MSGSRSRTRGAETERMVVGPIQFEVIGAPAPQGSKRHVGRGIMVESSKAVAPWRDSVAWAAREAMGGRDPIDGPVALAVDFRLAPTGRWTVAERMVGRRWKPRKPDLDKLLRSTLDALVTGGAIADDARVVSLTATKCEHQGASGATVTLTALDVMDGAA